MPEATWRARIGSFLARALHAPTRRVGDSWTRREKPFWIDAATRRFLKKYNKDSRVKNRLLGFRLNIGYLRMFSRVVFIVFYGLGFWLLSLQVIGVFRPFGWFLEGSRGLERRLLRLGLLGSLQGR
ncbi:transmembrane protein, putative [Medicago truncatula]|uniref:Transmembrane protein, putative n=1 Tax=Medicago truncatula TaxID=3880 RepID=A0A072UI63_MEDTR|nr:transmembrane protein, putative [Medicago truncatula]